MNEQDKKPEEKQTELGPEELEKVNGGAKVSKVDALTIKQTVARDALPVDEVAKK